MKFINIFLAVVVCALVQGCNIVNPAEQIPTFIHIDSFTFIDNPDPSKPPAGMHKIGSVWVYYNNNPVGQFDLPADVPVLATGYGQLQLAAGITQNGLESYQSLYPFYQRDTSSFEAVPGKTINYTPKTQYSYALFPWTDNFDNGSSSFTPIDANGANMIPVPYGSSTGAKYGNITLTHEGDSTEVISQKSFKKPSTTTFCELEYKSDVPIYMGLLGATSTATIGPYYIIGLKENADWQKIYINLATFISNYPADNYFVVFKAVVPAGKQSGNVSLDNLKIVTQ